MCSASTVEGGPGCRLEARGWGRTRAVLSLSWEDMGETSHTLGLARPPVQWTLTAQGVEGSGHQYAINILQPFLYPCTANETKIKHQTTKSSCRTTTSLCGQACIRVEGSGLGPTPKLTRKPITGLRGASLPLHCRPRLSSPHSTLSGHPTLSHSPASSASAGSQVVVPSHIVYLIVFIIF